MKQSIVSKIKNNKGETTLVFVFAMMFFFWMVLFMVDMFRLTNIYLDAVSLTRRVTEVVSTQGGVLKTVPTNYPTPSTYTTVSEMASVINSTMSGNGIEEGDVTIRNLETGGTMRVTAGANGISIDYGDEIEVSLRYKFKFESMPDFADSSMVFKITRKAGSQYKTRDSGWEGEEVA